MYTESLFRPEVFASRRTRLYGDVLLTVPVPVSATALAAVAATVLLVIVMGAVSYGRSFHGVARIWPAGDPVPVTASQAGVLRGIHVEDGALVAGDQAVASVALAGGEHIRIVAPADGVVVAVRDDLLGQLVVPGQTLGRILPVGGADLEAGLVVPSGFRNRVGAGRQVSLRFDCGPGLERDCLTAVGRVSGFPAESGWRGAVPVDDDKVVVTVALDDAAPAGGQAYLPGVLRTVRVNVEKRSLWGWLLGT